MWRSVLAVVLFGLLGCTADADPDPTPSPTASVSASPSASVTPAAMSPEDVVRAWVDGHNAALASGDVSGMTALHGPRCRGCDELTASITSTFEEGGSYSGGEWSVVESRRRFDRPDLVSMDVSMRESGGTTIANSGASPVAYEEVTRTWEFRVRAADSGWLIVLIALVG